MVTPCFFIVLCLLLGGHLEGRPIPQDYTQNEEDPLMDNALEPPVEGNTSLYEDLTALTQPDINSTEDLQERLFREEDMSRAYAPKKDWLDYLTSALKSWLIVVFGVVAICLCLILRCMHNFFEKHGDKIPIDKLVDLYAKKKQGKYRYDKLPS